MQTVRAVTLPALLAAAALLFQAVPAAANAPAAAAQAADGPSYADLADLTDSAQQVLRAEVRKLAAVDAERAPGLKPGWGRFYVEANTKALIFGSGLAGEKLRYLVDLRLDAKGKPPAVKKKDVLLFARGAAGRPGEIQLAAPDGQLVWDSGLEQQVRSILTELHAQDAPPRIKGVREAIHVPGNLAGAGETQLFLATEDNSAAAITLRRQGVGAPPQWDVSFSEVATGDGKAPSRDTLAWYRLACFLPQKLPEGVNLSGGAAERHQADVDYRHVLADLGPCNRSRK